MAIGSDFRSVFVLVIAIREDVKDLRFHFGGEERGPFLDGFDVLQIDDDDRGMAFDGDMEAAWMEGEKSAVFLVSCAFREDANVA